MPAPPAKASQRSILIGNCSCTCLPLSRLSTILTTINQVWKAEITARTEASPAPQVLAQCQALSKRTPPITDPRLLQLLYDLLVNLNHATSSDPSSINSAGPEAQQFWQNAAKSARSAKERLKLFSSLFAIALKADCWEDVRWVSSNSVPHHDSCGGSLKGFELTPLGTSSISQG